MSRNYDVLNLFLENISFSVSHNKCCTVHRILQIMVCTLCFGDMKKSKIFTRLKILTTMWS